VTAVDSSVAVAAILSAHEAHELCRERAIGAWLPAHVVAETYSVLTRLPPRFRLDPATAVTLIEAWFPVQRQLRMPAVSEAVGQLAEAGISGGATYDGLIALSSKASQHLLLSRDIRAARTYHALGVAFELL